MLKINTISGTKLLLSHTLLSCISSAICLIYLSDMDRLLKIGQMFSCHFIWLLTGTEMARFLMNIYVLKFELSVRMVTGKTTKTSRTIKLTKNCFQTILLAMGSVIIFGFVCIIFGAPIFDNHESTLALSIVLTTLTIFPLALYLKSYTTIEYLFSDTFELNTKTEMAYLKLIKCNAIGAIIGAWSASVLEPLDWNCKWQTYPIPNICGAILGHFIGNLYACACCLVQSNTKKGSKIKSQ